MRAAGPLGELSKRCRIFTTGGCLDSRTLWALRRANVHLEDERIRELGSVLRRVGCETSLASGASCSLLWHAKYAHARKELAQAGLVMADVRSSALRSAGFAVFSRHSCIRVEDPRFDSPLFIVRRGAARDNRSPFTAALAKLHGDAFFSDLCAVGAPLCIDLGMSTGSITHSFTVTELPGTVFSEHHPNAFINAENLVHEAAHGFLNAMLRVHGIALESQRARFWSPWKNSLRPLFGFLHACFAFSVVAIHHRDRYRHASAPAVLSQDLQCKLQLLVQAAPAFFEAVSEVKADEVAELLTLVYLDATAR